MNRGAKLRPGTTFLLGLILCAALLPATLGSGSPLAAAPHPTSSDAKAVEGPQSAASVPLRLPTTTSGCPIASAAPLAHALGLSPSAAPSYGEDGGLYAHSVDPQAVPNTGFTFNLTAYKLPVPAPNVNDSFLLSEEEEIGDTVLLMGFISVGQFAPSLLPFWAVLSNVTKQFTTCGYEPYAPSPGTVVSFQAVHLWENDWEVLYRGSPIVYSGVPSSDNITLSYDQANFTGAIGVVTLANWTGNDPWLPAYANLTGAMEVLTSNGWYLPHPVVSTWNGSTGGPFWGEGGPLQLPFLAPGGLEIGVSVPVVANGTVLWDTAAPTPLLVSVTASPSHLSGGALSTITVEATATDHTPIAGLGVLLSFAGGGSFAPAPPWTTNSAGIAVGNFTAPIVSALLNSSITAEVSSSLYQGTGSTPVVVAPTTLTVTVTVQPGAVAEGGTVNVTARATLGGSPLRGPTVDLDFAASVGGGAFSPLGAWVVNAQGYANGTYQAPHTAGTVVLTFTVSLTGYGGAGSVELNVTGSAPSSKGTTLLEEEVGAGVAVVLVVLVLLALMKRGRSPSTDEGEDGVEAEKATPTAEVPASSAKKSKSPTAEAAVQTCPGCGKEIALPDERFCPSCGAPVRKRSGPAAKVVED